MIPQTVIDALTPLLDEGKTIADRTAVLNEIRSWLHQHSPFAAEPVDYVRWEPAAEIQANDYNPNSVAPPEMELLRLSIQADGYTQPIVANREDGALVVVDGFHRNRVGKECPDVVERLHGFLPVVQINADRVDRADRMASTIRHNRARGKHQVIAMSDIVMELKRRNWSEGRIAKELGMDADEVLRLCQITGLAEAFADRDFSDAWQHIGAPEEIADDPDVEYDLEWMRGAPVVLRDPGWDDRTENSSVFYGPDHKQRGSIQRSRFTEGEWFWYAYTVPPSQGRAAGRDAARGELVAALHVHSGELLDVTTGLPAVEA